MARRLMLLLGLAVAIAAASTGTSAAASPCDPIAKRSNELSAQQLAFTKQAYADGKITAAELAQADAYAKAIAKVTDDLSKCIQTGYVPPEYLPADPDKDGVTGTNDKCPKKDGPAWNRGCPGPPTPNASQQRKAFRHNSAVCSLDTLRRSAKHPPAGLDGRYAIAKVKRCYAKNIPGVPDRWPILTFFAGRKMNAGFDVYTPELRPSDTPPDYLVNLKAKSGFNAYAVAEHQFKWDRKLYGLPVWGIYTNKSTPTATGGYLGCGVIYPDVPGPGDYKRIKL